MSFYIFVDGRGQWICTELAKGGRIFSDVAIMKVMSKRNSAKGRGFTDVKNIIIVVVVVKERTRQRKADDSDIVIIRLMGKRALCKKESNFSNNQKWSPS